MTIKNIIKNNLVSPGLRNSTGQFYEMALVLKSKERQGVCDIRYEDANGIVVTKRSVPVRMQSESFIDWFPSKGEFVTIMVPHEDPIITGPSDLTSVSEGKSGNILESDIFSDNVSAETEGGYIY